MAVFLTGGMGHVGSWIAHHLAKSGKKVILCDIAVREFDHLAPDYLKEVRDQLTLESADVLDFHAMLDVIHQYQDQIEGIIHTVAVIAGPHFQVHPYKNISINTLGLLNVLEMARMFHIPKFVNLSSGAVYGDTKGKLTEDTPYKATDLYGATKIANEIFGLQYAETYGLDVRNARLYFIYGPGKLPSRMHSLYQALFGPLEGLTNIVSPSGADQVADFTHASDAAMGVVQLFEKEKVNHRHFNISSGIPVSAGEIVRIVKEVLGRDTDVQLGSGMFIQRGAPLDISRAREELGFEPKFADIREGILDYYQWLQKACREETN